jgi:AcrR family transcriptional regulator
MRSDQRATSEVREAPVRVVRPNSVRHHGNRHGRSQAARMAVLEAADDLLVEFGFSGLTIEGIAIRAGVAKQTIYRWWTSKTDILLESLAVDATEHFTALAGNDLGSDRGELPRTEDIDLATDQLVGPIYYRVLVTHEPVPAQFTDALVARYLDGGTGGGS